jgi:ABC-2 type transport system permease protein
MGYSIIFQTARENVKATVALSLLFMLVSVLYAAIYPPFKDYMEGIMQDAPMMPIRGYESTATYPGFLNVELYQIFWVLFLAIAFGYIAGSLISKEVESKTMDMLLSNPVPRYRVVLEKLLGLIPMIFIVNFATFVAVVAVTVGIGEELSFGGLLLTHIMSLPYFIAVLAIGILASTIIDEKMKASIAVIAIVMGSYILQTVSLLTPDYENLGWITLTHYYDPSVTLLEGNVNVVGALVLMAITIGCLLAAIWYFERRDIRI